MDEFIFDVMEVDDWTPLDLTSDIMEADDWMLLDFDNENKEEDEATLEVELRGVELWVDEVLRWEAPVTDDPLEPSWKRSVEMVLLL